MTGGGTPREVQEDAVGGLVPDGRSFGVVHRRSADAARVSGGKVLFKTTGWITNPRVSPDGRSVAFLHHPVQGDDGGSVDVVDAAGTDHNLASDFSTEAASPVPDGGRSGSAAESGGNRCRYTEIPTAEAAGGSSCESPET
jgi:hypothetical protein